MTAYRWLLAAVLFFVVAHVLALVTMGTLLLPGIGPAGVGWSAARAAYIAEHPWAWRIGWMPWQACAASDLAVSIALIAWARTRGGVGWAWAGLVLNVLASVPEQWAEWRAVTEQVDLAGRVVAGTVDAHAHQTLEQELIWITGTLANTFYVAMTAAWMLAVRRTKRWGRAAWASAGLLVAFMLAGSFGAMAQRPGPSAPMWFQLASVANGVAFPGLILWSVVWTGAIGRIERAHRGIDEGFDLRWPSGRRGALLAGLGEHGVRDLVRLATRPIPQPRLASDITDVVYLSYMVPVDRVRGLVDDRLALDVRDGLTAISVLTYRHGHFGPRLAGPLRRLLPGPVQSNWRLYLREHGIAFFTNAIDHALYAVGARVMSDGLPTHVCRSASLTREDGRACVELDAGDGSAPALSLEVREGDEVLPEGFACFGGYRDAVAYLVAQDRAERIHAAVGLRSISGIRIPIDPAEVVPAQVESMRSPLLEPLVEGCEPLAFIVPRVPFSTTGERLEPLR